MSAARFLVSGQVQGVSFRASTRAQATQRALRGHARNLSDGSVEVLVAGQAAAIDALENWLRRGPPLARVDGLLREDLPHADVPEGFRIG